MKCVAVPADGQHVRFPDGTGGVELVQLVAERRADRKLLARLAALFTGADAGVLLTTLLELHERHSRGAE